MILYVTGNLFQSPAQVLVNTVNTVGVMGKGVAYEFKRLLPEMFAQYRDLCEKGQITVGKLWLYQTPNKWVLNFPTKKHWREPSRLEYITAGLDAFVRHYARLGIHSIAFPPLGCGNGQLDFGTQVQPVMERYLRNLPIEVFIYPGLKGSLIPEHQNVEEMRAWLRSEPTSLPFSEVWDDLAGILADQNSFRTLDDRCQFALELDHQAHELHIIADGRERPRVSYDALLAFWQQLRTHGFSMQQIAPALGEEAPFILPLFARLPYVATVRLADHYDRFSLDPIVGLQVLPRAFMQHSAPAQMALFEMG